MVSYAKDGEVLVIESPVFMKGKPFPNLYWLVYSPLKKAIDRLEAGGVITDLQQMLDTDMDFRGKVHEDHQRYIQKRLSLVTDEMRAHVENKNYLAVLEKKGIGGIADFNRVRCLHMHFAHYIVDRNTIGELLVERYNLDQIYS